MMQGENQKDKPKLAGGPHLAEIKLMAGVVSGLVLREALLNSCK